MPNPQQIERLRLYLTRIHRFYDHHAYQLVTQIVDGFTGLQGPNPIYLEIRVQGGGNTTYRRLIIDDLFREGRSAEEVPWPSPFRRLQNDVEGLVDTWMQDTVDPRVRQIIIEDLLRRNPGSSIFLPQVRTHAHEVEDRRHQERQEQEVESELENHMRFRIENMVAQYEGANEYQVRTTGQWQQANERIEDLSVEPSVFDESGRLRTRSQRAEDRRVEEAIKKLPPIF